MNCAISITYYYYSHSKNPSSRGLFSYKIKLVLFVWKLNQTIFSLFVFLKQALVLQI